MKSNALLGTLALLIFTLLVTPTRADNQPLFRLEGKAPRTAEPCALTIFETNGNEALVSVLVEDGHGEAESENEPVLKIVVRPGAKPATLEGSDAATQSTLKILLHPSGTTIEHAETFGFRFAHGSHFHSAACVGLKRTQE